MKVRIGLSVLALLLTGCQDIPGGPTAQPQVVGTPVDLVLAVGQEGQVDGILHIAFTDVKADSRCPSSVVCVWAGDGDVEITAAFGDGPSHPLRLHTVQEPMQVDFGGYRIRLVDLMPYPAVPGRIPLDEYAIRLEVGRLAE